MNLKRLETFVWVATLGSFRKAAERQHATQPAISSRIAALEEELGTKLFERELGPVPITLTAKGKELLPFAEKILVMAQHMQKRASKTLSLSGLLRLGAAESIVNTWLPVFLKELRRRMPDLDVDLVVQSSAEMERGLVDRSIDLAFLLGPCPEPSIVSRDLCTYPLIWAASPDLDLPKRLLYLEEIGKWPIITYARNTLPYSEVSQKFREQDGLPVRFFSSSSLATCRQMAIDGTGIATLPEVMIRPELESGELVRVRSTWTPTPQRFTVCYPAVPFNPLMELAADLAVEVAVTYEAKNSQLDKKTL